MNTDQRYLLRTAQLALLGDNRVLDSPRVGSVLVHKDRIIGEGYHRQSGKAHAEVNCLASVKPPDRHLIPFSSLYVSLEPCCIVGKTGACSTLILHHGIPKVVIGQRDSTPGVAGSSVALLRAAGVEVIEYPEFEPTKVTSKYREVLVKKGRPYVTLKYAQSNDGFLRPADRARRYWITNAISRRLVHRWRAETTAILVGAGTVLDDDPSLTTRLWAGPNAVPVIIDPKGRVTGREKVFAGPREAILYTSVRPRKPSEGYRGTIVTIPPNLTEQTLLFILQDLGQRRLANVTVEGGAALLAAVVKAGLWEEARVFTGRASFGVGLPAPALTDAGLVSSEMVGGDGLAVYCRVEGGPGGRF